MTEVLLEQVGPNGNVQAVVESDGTVCFLYLLGAPETELGVRSVWIRNLVPAPETLDRDRMREGSPPLNPAPHCRYPNGQELLSSDRLRLVWLPEGNGVALYEEDGPLAILPPWSGQGGFHGYARDSVGDGPLAWELEPDNAILARFAAAEEFWREWGNESSWASVQQDLLDRVEGTLGPHSNYYAIDGGNWPPRALVRIPREESVVLVTIGLSIRPQPNVEMYVEDPSSFRRIELGAVLPDSWSNEDVLRFAGYFSAQAELPWTRYTWLGPGHTIPCDSWVRPEHTFALVLSESAGAPTPDLGVQFGDPVRMLWFCPITKAERDRAVASSGAEVAEALPKDRWKYA